MALSVRLDPETRKMLERIAREQRLSRSEVVRRGIRLLGLEASKEEVNPYDEIRHLLGRVRGGPADLSERTGQRFRKALLERRSRK